MNFRYRELSWIVRHVDTDRVVYFDKHINIYSCTEVWTTTVKSSVDQTCRPKLKKAQSKSERAKHVLKLFTRKSIHGRPKVTSGQPKFKTWTTKLFQDRLQLNYSLESKLNHDRTLRFGQSMFRRHIQSLERLIRSSNRKHSNRYAH